VRRVEHSASSIWTWSSAQGVLDSYLRLTKPQMRHQILMTPRFCVERGSDNGGRSQEGLGECERNRSRLAQSAQDTHGSPHLWIEPCQASVSAHGYPVLHFRSFSKRWPVVQKSCRILFQIALLRPCICEAEGTEQIARENPGEVAMYHTIEFKHTCVVDLETSPRHHLERAQVRRGTQLLASVHPYVREVPGVGPVETANLCLADGSTVRDVPYEWFRFVDCPAQQ